MEQPSELLTHHQRQTLPARRALEKKLASPTQKTEHFRGLARKSHERRITLSGDEAAALVDAYALLGRIAERARLKLEGSPQESA